MASNLDEYFAPIPGAKNDKNIVIFARRHWISFLGDILVSIFLLLTPAVIILIAHYFLPDTFQGAILNFLVVFGSAYYLIILTFIFSAWISYYYDIYILTRDEIIDISQSGFFNRKISQLSLLRVQDVSSKIDGFLPTFFVYGDVLVETAGEKVENFLLRAIPNPQEFSAKVLEMHDQLIETKGRQGQIAEGEGFLTAPKTQVRPAEAESEIPIQQISTEVVEKPMENKKADIVSTQNFKEGEIQKDDLNQGGEVKL